MICDIYGTSKTEAIFIIRQVQWRLIPKDKKLYYVFADLENVLDRVPDYVR